jgi:hypothetical protein
MPTKTLSEWDAILDDLDDKPQQTNNSDVVHMMSDINSAHTTIQNTTHDMAMSNSEITKQ